MPLISKAKSIEAQTQLKYLYNTQKQYHFMYSKYSSEFSELDFEAPKTVQENGTANYTYEILNVSNTDFKIRATAITDFDGDGVFNVWEIDQEGNATQVVND
jgi:type IV pilus assembly protein PilE